MKSLEKALLPSKVAACFVGPNTLWPCSSNKSASPIHNGTSGPITVKSILLSSTNFKIPSKSSTLPGWQVPIWAIPGFPGIALISSTRGLLFNPYAIACSRPPLPIINTFMVSSFYDFGYTILNLSQTTSISSVNFWWMLCISLSKNVLWTSRQ